MSFLWKLHIGGIFQWFGHTTSRPGSHADGAWFGGMAQEREVGQKTWLTDNTDGKQSHGKERHH